MRMLYYIICIYTYFFSRDIWTSIIWNRSISWWSPVWGGGASITQAKQWRVTTKRRLTCWKFDGRLDFYTRWYLWDPRSLTNSKVYCSRLVVAWVLYSLLHLCILADRGWSDILKEGSRSPVADYQHTSSLAARWTSHSIHRCAFFLCHLHRSQMCRTQSETMRVSKMTAKSWNTVFFPSKMNGRSPVPRDVLRFSYILWIPSIFQCFLSSHTDMFAMPSNNIHPPWFLDSSFCQGGGACWKIRARSHSAALGSRCQIPKHWRFEFQMMEELLMVLDSRRNHMYWWMFFAWNLNILNFSKNI